MTCEELKARLLAEIEAIITGLSLRGVRTAQDEQANTAIELL